MRLFNYLSTTAVFYFLTTQQALAAGTGGGLPTLEQPAKKFADTLTGPLAHDLTAVGGVAGAFMMLGSNHGPVTQRFGSFLMAGGIACNIKPLMNTLGWAGATF